MRKVLLASAIVGIGVIGVAGSARARSFSPGAEYQVCFNPGGLMNCETLVATMIRQAHQQVLMQAYELTDRPITEALIDAHRRGVEVYVIVDKSQMSSNYSTVRQVIASGIRTSVDTTVRIAHNKVVIVDGRAVFTGSYNFTQAATRSNAENGLVIEDATLAGAYIENFENRMRVSSLASAGDVQADRFNRRDGGGGEVRGDVVGGVINRFLQSLNR